MTPTVSRMACGFNIDTDAAKRICFLIVIPNWPSSLVGALFQTDHPIYKRKRTPTANNTVLSHAKEKTINETPKTAVKIKIVSHSPAVKTTGIVFMKDGCLAPTLKTKTF